MNDSQPVTLSQIESHILEFADMLRGSICNANFKSYTLHAVIPETPSIMHSGSREVEGSLHTTQADKLITQMGSAYE